jgi:hypothetical protein
MSIDVICFLRQLPDFDLHHWFDHEELDPCPACGERAALRLQSSSLLCIDCGHLQLDVTESTNEIADSNGAAANVDMLASAELESLAPARGSQVDLRS